MLTRWPHISSHEFVQEAPDLLWRGFGQQLLTIFPDVAPKEVKAVVDVAKTGLLLGEATYLDTRIIAPLSARRLFKDWSISTLGRRATLSLAAATIRLL